MSSRPEIGDVCGLPLSRYCGTAPTRPPPQYTSSRMVRSPCPSLSPLLPCVLFYSLSLSCTPAEKLLARLLNVVCSPTSVLPSRESSDAVAVRELLGVKTAVFDLFHNLIVHRQKAKALLSDPGLQSALASAYAALQDGALLALARAIRV